MESIKSITYAFLMLSLLGTSYAQAQPTLVVNVYTEPGQRYEQAPNQCHSHYWADVSGIGSPFKIYLNDVLDGTTPGPVGTAVNTAMARLGWPDAIIKATFCMQCGTDQLNHSCNTKAYVVSRCIVTLCSMAPGPGGGE